MTIRKFDPDNTLAGGLSDMAPKEAVALGAALCAAVEQAVGADGCHGSVWPGNITWSEGEAAVGEAGGGSVADLSPDELEFISPEQFWSGEKSPASDVYSIGLVLYTVLNRGVKPYFQSAEAPSPEARADALQARMKGGALPYPATAGRALGEVVLKAAAFRPEDRYATPGQLKAALESLPEGADVPAAVPVVPLSAAEKQAAPDYKVDKDFEDTVPEKPKKEKKPAKPKKSEGEVDEDLDAAAFRDSRKKGRWILPAVVIAIAVVVLILALRSCVSGEPGPAAETFPVETEPQETGQQIHAPVVETPPAWQPTAPPEETEPPETTDEPAAPAYEMVVADVTWTEARDLAEAKDGHLVTVRSAEQLREITALAAQNGVRFVWLGAYRDDNGAFRFVTGEFMDYAAWDEGEPSGSGSSGVSEDYVLLWDRPNAGIWSYNDTVNDVVGLLPRTYSGHIAYVIQYDE